MPKVIQIRNVPDELHKRLKIRAAEKHTSLSGYMLEIAERELDAPNIEKLLERVRARTVDNSDFDATTFIRNLRDSL